MCCGAATSDRGWLHLRLAVEGGGEKGNGVAIYEHIDRKQNINGV